MDATASRILIVNQNWLGDVLFSTPAIRAVRRRYPKAFIACLAPRRAAEALSHNPHLDEVIVYDERAALLTLFEPTRVLLALLRRRFDTALLFHRSRSKAFLTLLAGIPHRIGYARAGRGWLLTQAVPPALVPVHKIDHFLALVEKAGIPGAGREPEVHVTREEEMSLAKLLAEAGLAAGVPYAVVHAGGNWDLKRWPADYFIHWSRLFLEKNKGWKVVLCGASSEKALVERILEGCRDGGVVSLCGRTSFGQLAALMKQARFVLSNDSGPIHVAASQGTPILGLYGPTSPRETGPVSKGPVRLLWQDVGCTVPCYFRSCQGRACMELLTPEEVLERAEELLAL